MEMRRGYKQTEAGLLPSDWSVVTLEEITTDISDGLHGTPVYSADGDYAFINGNNLDDGKISISIDTKKVSHTEFKKHQKPLTNRTILLSINGTIGNLGLYDGEPIVLGKSAAYLNLRPKTSRLFVYHVLKTQAVKKQFLDGMTGSTIGNLGLAAIRRTQVVLPPLREQCAIAEALSDADARIKSLDQLIAKKRQIKQAAMQELLIGRTRLSSFHREWEVKALGEIASIAKGTQLNSRETIAEGQFPHFNGGISPSGYTFKTNAAADTIVVSEGGNSCGYVQFISEPFWCGGHCYAVIPKGVHKRFLYHALKRQQSAIMGLRVGSGLPNVQKGALAAFRLDLPSDIEEQTAIAAVLSEMDTEIAALVRLSDKTRLIKQGMTQELLTGRIRLV